jgi:hypothetical protein
MNNSRRVDRRARKLSDGFRRTPSHRRNIRFPRRWSESGLTAPHPNQPPVQAMAIGQSPQGKAPAGWPNNMSSQAAKPPSRGSSAGDRDRSREVPSILNHTCMQINVVDLQQTDEAPTLKATINPTRYSSPVPFMTRYYLCGSVCICG